MKKYIKQIATFALIATLASCAADDDVDFTSVGGNVVPTTASISRLDNNYILPSSIFTKEGVTASKVEIYKNIAASTSDPIQFGAKVADATIADGKASFNTSSLGSFDIFPVLQDDGTTTLTGTTGTFPLAILTTYSDGSTTRAVFTLTVGKGIVWQVYNDDGDPVTSPTSTVSTIKYNDPTPVIITFAPVRKATTTVNSIVGEWSKNEGPFSALPGTLPIIHQDLNIAAIPYSTYGGIVVGDKITYKFTVTAGTQTDYITTTVEFVNQDFDAAHAGSISNSASTSKFSFLTELNYDAIDTKNAEIAFVAPFGFQSTEVVAPGKTPTFKFVVSALNYDTADLFTAEAAYTAGVKVTSLNNLATGNVIVYKITRSVNFGSEDEPDYQDVVYTGILKITDRIQGTSSQQLKFAYKEGVLSVEDPI